MAAALPPLCACALAAGTAHAAADAAQAGAAIAGTVSYTATDFARFAPTTALDMVRQIPGFIVAEAEERRGLGQGGDNVLINGKRVTGKSNDAVAALSRIAAASVQRIDVVDAASLDVPGLSGRVVNVIADVSAFTGQFRWSPQLRLRRTDPRLLDGEITVSGNGGRLDYSLSLDNVSRRNGNAGFELAYDGNGALFDRRYEVLFVDEDAPRIRGTLRYAAENGNVANLNASYQRFYLTLTEDSDRVDRVRDFRQTEREYNYEVGGDYEFALGGGRLKLIGLHRFEHSPVLNTVIFTFDDGRPATGDRFRQNADETETIARAEYGWSGGRSDWQVAAEGAFNTLDVEADLARLDLSGSFVPVPIPGATATVKEKRGDVAISVTRRLSDVLTLQASLAGEYSRLTQSGPDGLTRSFVRPKGFVSLAWKASPRLDVRARVERAVGQLNFFDFIASTDVSAGNSNASNPNLVPDQRWKAEVEATRNLGAFGSATAKLYADFVSDIVDLVPIGEHGEAPGNVDRATIWGVEWNSTFNFDPFGWRGARLDIDFNWFDSSLDDPLTGKPRKIGDQAYLTLNAEFRHDIPTTEWAYGITYDKLKFSRFVRLGEIGRFYNAPGELGVFVENKDVLGARLRLGVGNLLGTNEGLDRTIYVARRDGPVLVREDRKRFYGPVFTLDICGSF
jgi:hypothetical protein